MLSTDAKNMIFVLYKEYKNRRKHGLSKEASKEFQEPGSIQESFFPSLTAGDVEDTLRELNNKGYLQVDYCSGIIYTCSITDDAIAELDNQPKETLLSVADFVSKFIP